MLPQRCIEGSEKGEVLFKKSLAQIPIEIMPQVIEAAWIRVEREGCRRSWKKTLPLLVASVCEGNERRKRSAVFSLVSDDRPDVRRVGGKCRIALMACLDIKLAAAMRQFPARNRSQYTQLARQARKNREKPLRKDDAARVLSQIHIARVPGAVFRVEGIQVARPAFKIDIDAC